MIGERIFALAKELYPINRSLTGAGVRETLKILSETCPMSIYEVPSGTKVFDWSVPKEWSVKEAYIQDSAGHKIVDFKENNLHLVGYSAPIDVELDLEELNKYLYSLKELPFAIPYITSYYAEKWGFCISENQRKSLKPGKYRAYIDSELKVGSLTYGEILIPGESVEEVFISTYICHPSMANNELSGPCVTIHLAEWLKSLPSRKYTYRIIFIPETIGSITYLSKNLDHLKSHVIAGFNVTCVGDNRAYSYLPSKAGNTISDEVAKHILKWIDPSFKSYSWHDRGSDERQYCAPGVDLPIASIMRTKYGQYPEYHTSLDNFDVVTPEGLGGGFLALKKAIQALESNCFPKVTVLCEPQLGRRGLYPTTGTRSVAFQVKLMMDLISYSDGTLSLLAIAEKCNVPIWELYPIVENLSNHGLLKV